MSGGQTISQTAVRLGGLSIQNTGYGVTIPILYGKNRVKPTLIEYTNFVATAHTSQQTQGGKGGGGTTMQTTTYTYSAAVIMGLCEGQVQAFGQMWIDKNIHTSPASKGFSMFYGTTPQSPWSWMTTYYPSRAIGYQALAYCACANYDLGNQASLGNHSFEITGLGTLQNGTDVNVIDVITDFCNNVNYGAMFPYLGTTALARDYAQANGLFIAPLLDVQKTAADWLKQFAMIANAGLVWSNGLLKIIPYGDQVVTGNGVTYTPVVTVQYNLTDDDFQPQSGGDPIMVTRVKQVDAFNSVQIEYANRNNQYNLEPAEVKDQANIEIYGLRKMSPMTLHEICVPQVAKTVAQTALQRQLYIRNTFNFVLTWKYCLLEPMDIVTLTDSQLGLNQTLARIVSIEETFDGLLTVSAEEMPFGVAQPAWYAQPTVNGYSPNFNAPAPSTNTPIIFAPPMELATSTLELWLAACGPVASGWGGCNVLVSSDGNTYGQAGVIHGSARMGVLNGVLASGVDPDTAHTLRVNLSSSIGVLFSGTQADADSFHTLCYVDGEFLSYQNATLTSANNYDLTYLRRGAYKSAIASHVGGAAFARLDDAIFKLPYTADQIGKTIYVKLQSFNQFQGGIQDIATLTAFPVVVPSPPPPVAVTNFACQQNGNVVVFTWSPVVDYALRGYDLGYAPQGSTNWSNFILLTETARGTEMTNAAVPPGTWVFGIRAKDAIGQLSPTITMFNMIVTNASPIVANVQQDPMWAGALASMVQHYTGVLVPMGTLTSDQYAALPAPVSAPTLGTVVGGALALRTYYVRVNYDSATGETLCSAESNISVPAGSLLVVTPPPAITGATAWSVYVATTTNTETEQNVAPLGLGVPWTEPNSGLIAGVAMPPVNTTGWEVFNIFVPDPVATCSYTAPTVDTGYNSTLRVYSSSTAVMGYAQSGTITKSMSLDTWLTGATDPNTYTLWTVGQVNMRYMNQRMALSSITQGAVPVLTAFSALADTTPVIENVVSVAIAAGGSAVTFPQPYHTAPLVICSALGTTALIANASNITATGCTIHVFDAAGTDVGGTVTYTTTGS
jgi:hypothetical protein